MSNITVTFNLTTLEGATANVVGVSRSGTFTATGFTASVFEQLNVAQSSTDVLFSVPATANKVLTIENAGVVDLQYRINSNTGTQLILSAGGFLALTTSTAITSFYFTNPNTTTACLIKLFIGG
jgi:hypothetical protein